MANLGVKVSPKGEIKAININKEYGVISTKGF